MKCELNPIIFIGTGRSGTTILSEMIMRHPDLAFPSDYNNKLIHLENINYVRYLFDNRFWRLFGQKKQINKVQIFNKYYFRPVEAYQMWDKITGPSIDFSRGFLLDEEIDNKRKKIIYDYFLKMQKKQGKKHLTFKITGPSRIGFLLNLFPNAKFINLTRNLIPTINSFIKSPFWETRGMHQLWWTGAYNEKEITIAKDLASTPSLITAFQLKKIMEVTQWEINHHNPQIITMSYENFVKNPKENLMEIIKFTNLSTERYDVDKYLDLFKIENRNKPDEAYFSKKELDEIYKII